MNLKIIFAAVIATAFLPSATAQEPYVSQVWTADNGDGTYRNPIIYADYSDPDVCRVGDDYYMTSSSFNCIPGLQILHSRDLVNWTIIGSAVPGGLPPFSTPARPEHGNRVWAPCIRHHGGQFLIYWGDPDQGAFMVRADSAGGPWSEPVLVKEGKGIIDTSPLWDDDGRVYMVHAYAGSRAGLKSVLAVCELNADGTKAITPSRIIYDGHEHNPTIEGPKFHKKDGFYYIFAPAGGVATGWQTVLRSESVYGPYEIRTVMAQGDTPVNGPHQGAWVDTPSGQHWFIHFQDVGPLGRIVHLQPMEWHRGWPVIGVDNDGDGCGHPVLTYHKPDTGRTYPITSPQESDEFGGPTLGPQWQWHANPDEKWVYLAGPENGYARLYSHPVTAEHKNLFDVPNLLLQKAPAPEFTATLRLRFDPSPAYAGERTGLLVMGLDYAGLFLENTPDGVKLYYAECHKADRGTPETHGTPVTASPGEYIHLRAVFTLDGRCRFAYSADGKRYMPLGEPFAVREGKWIGAKVGTFCTRPADVRNDGGWAELDWFRITRNE